MFVWCISSRSFVKLPCVRYSSVDQKNPFHGSASRSIAWLAAAYMLHVAVGEIMLQVKSEKDSFDSQIVLGGKGSRIIISLENAILW